MSAHQPAGIDAVIRHQHPVGHGDVCGREADLTTALVARHHRAPHLVRTTEHGVGVVETTLGQRPPDRGRTDLQFVAGIGSVGRHQMVTDHLEVALLAQFSEQSDVSLAEMSEVEVFADHDQAGTECLHQHGAHEVFGLLVGALGVEGHHHRGVDAGGGQQFELLAQVGEQTRG